MRDLVFLAVIVGFFALAALVVAACDRIVGPDPADLDHPGKARPMTVDNVIGLVLALLTAAYLVAALIAPERF